MVMLGQIKAFTCMENVVGPSHKHAPHQRQRTRVQTLMHAGKRVCKETFLALHTIGIHVYTKQIDLYCGSHDSKPSRTTSPSLARSLGCTETLRKTPSNTLIHAAIRAAAYNTLWRRLLPHITVMRPMTDLCFVCQQNSTAIVRSANKAEEDKKEVCHNYFPFLSADEKAYEGPDHGNRG